MFETTLYLTLAIVCFIAPAVIVVTLRNSEVIINIVNTLHNLDVSDRTMLAGILAGISVGALCSLFWCLSRKFYKFYYFKKTKKINLKGYRCSEPDPSQLCFVYDDGYYPYLDFLFSQTLSRMDLSQKFLVKEMHSSFESKNRDSLVEIEFYAASVAIALKKNRMKSYESIRMATKWVVENKNELDAASNPMDVCEKLSQQDFSPKHR